MKTRRNRNRRKQTQRGSGLWSSLLGREKKEVNTSSKLDDEHKLNADQQVALNQFELDPEVTKEIYVKKYNNDVDPTNKVKEIINEDRKAYDIDYRILTSQKSSLINYILNGIGIWNSKEQAKTMLSGKKRIDDTVCGTEDCKNRADKIKQSLIWISKKHPAALGKLSASAAIGNFIGNSVSTTAKDAYNVGNSLTTSVVGKPKTPGSQDVELQDRSQSASPAPPPAKKGYFWGGSRRNRKRLRRTRRN